jgi:uncharacterized protein (DUF433 family)
MNPYQHVVVDPEGAIWVGTNRISMASVVAARELYGQTPEEIAEDFPSMTLEEAREAVRYYEEHPEEIRAYMKRQEQLWEEFKRRVDEQPTPPVVERLRALKRQGIESQ